MMIHSKKGSFISEAAVILPVIIITVSLLITVSANKYDEVRCQAEARAIERNKQMENGKINTGEADFIRSLDFLAEEIKDESKMQ